MVITSYLNKVQITRGGSQAGIYLAMLAGCIISHGPPPPPLTDTHVTVLDGRFFNITDIYVTVLFPAHLCKFAPVLMSKILHIIIYFQENTSCHFESVQNLSVYKCNVMQGHCQHKT